VRLAYYSPLPPERSGIADYSALLLPALERRFEVAVARRGQRPPDSDVALYHVGNDPNAHDWIVEALARRPGVVVLHELVLHHLVAGLTLARGDPAAYLDAMERDSGLPGRLLAHAYLDGRIPALWETRPEDFPLAGGILDSATAVIVHSRHLDRRVRELGYRGRVWRIQMPAWPDVPAEPEPLEGRPLIGSFGHLNAAKRIPQLLEAFARVRESQPEARLLLVGSAAPGLELPWRLARLGLDDGSVVWEDYVDEARLWGLLGACDVFVGLRAPTMGETSASVIRALSAGLPVVVSDVGWFSELPGEVALKVPVDEREVETLVAALELLGGNERARAAMSAAARDYVRREHDLERSAEAYAAALEWAAGGESVTDAVLGEVALAAAEAGIGRDSPELAEIAVQVRESGIAG
jgi:glycosyltransferase involved in cell wall biosynthesis